MGDSNFLCLEYDGRDDLEDNDTDSWGGNHSCGTREMTIMVDNWGSNWTSDIQGIQGRLIVEYSKQRR